LAHVASCQLSDQDLLQAAQSSTGKISNLVSKSEFVALLMGGELWLGTNSWREIPQRPNSASVGSSLGEDVLFFSGCRKKQMS
jgi:hypothetical protein